MTFAALLLGLGATPAEAADCTSTALTACCTIRNSGTYTLSSDLPADGSTYPGTCIEINGASQVTLDGGATPHVVRGSGAAVLITNHSTGITVKNLKIAASPGTILGSTDKFTDAIAITGNMGSSCETASANIVLIDSVEALSGDITVGPGGYYASDACNLTVQNSTLSSGSIQISNYYDWPTNCNLLNNVVSGGLSLTHCSHSTISGNSAQGHIGLSYADYLTLKNNRFVVNDSYFISTDTNEALRMTNIKCGVFEDNYVENRRVAGPCADVASTTCTSRVTWKNYFIQHSRFKNNVMLGAVSKNDMGAIELRSASRDNYFYGNQFVSKDPSSEGYMSHFSNVFCDDAGVDCRGQTGCPMLPCQDRNNIFDTNYFEAGTTAVHNYGDGMGSQFINNVIVGGVGVDAGYCEAESGGTILYQNNTVYALSGLAFQQESSCGVVLNSNNFFSTGTKSASQSTPPLTGSYNNFWPAFSPTGPTGTVSSNPQFISPGLSSLPTGGISASSKLGVANFALGNTSLFNVSSSGKVAGAYSSSGVWAGPAVSDPTVAYCGSYPASDHNPPSISISSPANGSSISGTSVSVTVSASDNVAVTRVDLLVDGIYVTSSTTAPFNMTWSPTTGTHSLQAVAHDAAGNTASSTVINVSVSNGNPPSVQPPSGGGSGAGGAIPNPAPGGKTPLAGANPSVSCYQNKMDPTQASQAIAELVFLILCMMLGSGPLRKPSCS